MRNLSWLRFSLALLLAACGGRIAGENDRDSGVTPPLDAGTTPDTGDIPDGSAVHESTWVKAVQDVALVTAIVSDHAGGVYVSGDGAVVHIGPNGERLWTVSTYDLWSLRPGDNFVGALATDANGNVIVAGQGIAVLAASDGRPLWSARFNGTVTARAVSLLGDGTIASVGTFFGTTTFDRVTLQGPPPTGYVVRYDARGGFIGANLLSGVAPFHWGDPWAIADADGNLVFVTDGTVTVVDSSLRVLRTLPLAKVGQVAPGADGHLFTLALNAQGGIDLRENDRDGAAIWTYAFGTPNPLDPFDVVADHPRGVVVHHDALRSFDANGAVKEIIAQSDLDAIVAHALGIDGGVLYEGFQRIVVDRDGRIFMAGALGMSRTGASQVFGFVARIARP